MSGLCFALPPSLGTENVRTLAREFAAVLYDVGFSTVVPMASYELLERSLLNNDVDAAWGPPMVCAKLENVGGLVLFRGVRHGGSSYRSALVCRSHDDLTVDGIGIEGGRKLRAVWVDEHSMAGYIMPRHFLRSQGADLTKAFYSEEALGSYQACFEAIIEGDADISASYANARGVGYVELCADQAFNLRTIAYTSECSNDGVVLSPKASQKAKIIDRLRKLVDDPNTGAIFAKALEVDSFEEPPAGSYAALVSLLK